MNKNFYLGLGAILALGLTGCSNKTCSVKEAVTPVSTNKIRPGSPEDFAQNVPNKIHFRFNESKLTKSGEDRAATQAGWLKTYTTTKVIVEGHCDDRGTEHYNNALGAARAESTKRALVKYGVDPARINTISYGKNRPVAVVDPANPASAEEIHAMNRRTETVIVQ